MQQYIIIVYIEKKNLHRQENKNVAYAAEPDEHILGYYCTCKTGAETFKFMCACV